jgi:hypothetical protein
MLAFGGPTVTTNHGIPTVSWSLGAGEYVSNVEIATTPDVYSADQFLLGGSFRSTVYVARLLPQGGPATALMPLPFRNGIPLRDGMYYAHVHFVSGCSSWDFCTSDAWSPIVQFTVADSARPVRSGPPNSLAVRQVRVPGRFPHVQLLAQFRVATPDGCPAADPGIGDQQAALQWGSAYCTAYARQGADVRVRVVRVRRVVYTEQHPAYGPSWQTDLFPSAFRGGCKTGAYRWTVTLVDPYYRPDVSASGSFTPRCR